MTPFPERDEALRNTLAPFGERIIWHLPLAAGERLSAWSDELINRVSAFSEFLLQQPQMREFPDIIALAFWFRRANVNALQKLAFSKGKVDAVGRVFHIAPANVDTVFMYSVLLSVLSGNANIVRVSSRSGEVTWQLVSQIAVFNQRQPQHSLASAICIIEYDALHQNVTNACSEWSDLRVIWGGDSAISAISMIAPQIPQITFPDRFSYSVLHVADNTDINQLASRFLTDVVPFNQQACSSPKAIFWLNTSAQSQEDFWVAIDKQMADKPANFATADRVEQINFMQTLAMTYDNLMVGSSSGFAGLRGARQVGMMSVLKATSVDADMLSAHPGHGLILETEVHDISELPLHAKLQTIVTNSDENGSFAALHHVQRVAHTGNALTFSYIWDGVNLLEAFGRAISSGSDHQEQKLC